MPEDAEVDTDRLHEAVHEELGREGGRFLKQIALSTAVLAALASVASLKAGGTVNEALALKTDATLQRIRASTYEVHADVVPPRGATVHFRGIDEHVGAITKYTMVESDGRRT